MSSAAAWLTRWAVSTKEIVIRLSRFLVVTLASLSVLVGASLAQTSAAGIDTSNGHDSVPSLANFTKLADFGNGNGEYPNAPLAQGTDGDLYGTTQLGPWPSNGLGLVRSLRPSPHRAGRDRR